MPRIQRIAIRSLVPRGISPTLVTHDPDGDPALPNYGTKFRESEYAPIPTRDLPFGLPAWFGDHA